MRRRDWMALAAAPGRSRFFTRPEHEAIDHITEQILPADSHSPGARAARVADYIDLVLSRSPAAKQQQWRQALPALVADRASFPKSPLFADLKRWTLRGYYTSEIGLRQELGYQGPQALHAFPKCAR